MAEANAYQIGQLIAQLGLDNAQFMAGMQASIAQMGAADAAMKKTTASMTARLSAVATKAIAVGKTMTRALTLPIIGVGVGATKTFAEFEASMAKIVGLVGVNKQQVDKWSGAIKDLAVQMGRSPTELADAMFYITSAGLRGAEAMDVLRMSAKASVAGLGETKVIADLLTSSMNAYGSAILPASKAADILTAAVRAGKAEAESMAGAMGNVIPISSAMGMSFADLNASIAGMTRTGTPAVKAATQLKAILSAMASPSQKAEKAMSDMGYSSEQFRKTLKEKGFIEALDELKSVTDRFGGETALAKVFPNIRALVGAFDLLGANLEENRKVYDQVRNSAGILNEAYEAQHDTLKHQLQVAMATVKRTLTDLGETMKGPIVKAITNMGAKLRKMTEAWNGMTEAQKQAKIRIAGLIAVAGPLLSIIGKLTKAAIANPWVALAIAIGVLVARIVQLRRANKEAAETMGAVERASAKVEERYSKQRMEVQYLVAKIEDENAANEDRNRAINQLKSIIPEYNGMISEEGRLINHNTTAIQNYLTQLKEKIRVQAFEEEYTALIKKQIEARKQLEAADKAAFEARQKFEDAGSKETQEIRSASTVGAQATQTVRTSEYAAVVAETEELRLAQEAYNKILEETNMLEEEALKLKIDIGNTTPVVPVEGTGGTGSTGSTDSTDTSQAIVDLEEREAAKTKLLQDAENERASIIKNSYARQRQQEILAFQRQKEVYEQMAIEFPALKEQTDAAIEALEKGHQARLSTIAQEGWQAAIKEAMKKTKEEADLFKDNMKDALAIVDAWTTAGSQLQTVFNGIGSAIGLANNAAAQWISYVGRILSSVAGLIGTIKKLVVAKQAEATADAIAGGAKMPFPANLIAIAASVASVLASFASIPKLAAGGLAYGKTIAEVGEYPGAATNPEVIAPLNTLKKHLTPAQSSFGLPKTLELVLSGRNATALIDFERMLQKTY